MTHHLLLFFTGVLSHIVDVAGKNPEVTAASWGTYQWAEPWQGGWVSHIAPVDDGGTAEDRVSEESPLPALSSRRITKRHYNLYPQDLERPRRRLYGPGKELPQQATVWEEPPLLAKEGITSEEAVWVPQGEPLQLIKLGYSRGSEQFDQSFGREYPVLLVETPYRSYDNPLEFTTKPSYPPAPPPTLSTTTEPSTTPHTVMIIEPHLEEVTEPPPPVEKVKKDVVLAYNPHQPEYHIVYRHPNSPRKYYLNGDAPERPKNPHGLRKYFLDNQPKTVVTSHQNIVPKIPGYVETNTKRTKANEPTSSLLLVEEQDASTSSGDDGHSQKPPKHKSKKPQTTYPPPYGYKIQPRPRPVSHAPYKPLPYGHSRQPRPHYPLRRPYYPPIGTVRKYYLNPPTPSSHSPKEKTNESKQIERRSRGLNYADFSSSDVYEILRMPSSTDSITWQRRQPSRDV